MRTFIAYKIPWVEDFKKIKEMVSNSQMKVKWVERENTHITLKFLGEVDEGMLEKVDTVLKNVIPTFSSGKIQIKGVGAFPSLYKPRVIWVGAEDGGLLKEIFKKIDRELKGLGIPPEKRSFHPHLTIGRVRRFSSDAGECLNRVKEGFGDRVLWEGKIEVIDLMKSTLTAKGPIYDVLNSYKLKEV